MKTKNYLKKITKIFVIVIILIGGFITYEKGRDTFAIVPSNINESQSDSSFAYSKNISSLVTIPNFTKVAEAANGQCSTAYYSTCISGTVSGWSSSGGNATWQCVGTNYGTTANCSINVCNGMPINGCNIGATRDKTDGACTNDWECGPFYGGSYISCSTAKAATNGECSTTLNTCIKGTYSDVTDTATEYKWSCKGLCSGTTASCTKAKASCTLPWGGTIASGSSVTAYSPNSTYCGVYGNASQTRTCNDGTLSGSYTSQSAAAIATRTGKKSSSVSCGTACSDETQSCLAGGAWSGSGVDTCTASTQRKYAGITSGCGTWVAYEDQLCQSNGVWSGSFTLSTAPEPSKRTRYAALTTPSCGTYGSVSEEQVCQASGSFNGSYTLTSAPTISTRDGYTASSVACGSSCTYQKQTCKSTGWDGSGVTSCSVTPVNGTCNNSVVNGCSSGILNADSPADTASAYNWSCNGSCGGTSVTNCTKAKASCTLPWGGSITSGSKVTAYAAQTVAGCGTYGSLSQDRTCNDGTLDGSYTLQSAPSISQRTGKLASSNAGCGVYLCSDQIQYCQSNGSWGGSGTDSCTVASRQGYTASSVACGSSCTTQTQYCQSGGGWGGTGIGSCSVNPLNGSCNNSVVNGCSSGILNADSPADTASAYNWSCGGDCGGSGVTNCTKAKASCTLPWGGSITSGSKVTAYAAQTVAGCGTYGSLSQDRTCNDGTLSGSYTLQSAPSISQRTGKLAATSACGIYSCSDQTQYCQSNGSWGGSGTDSCTVASRQGYTASSVACGSSCTQQLQYCQSGGGWGGTGIGSCSVTPVNGTCNSSVVNACNGGDLSDTTDDTVNYKWDCNGSCGGSSESCTFPKPPVVVVSMSTVNGGSSGSAYVGEAATLNWTASNSPTGCSIYRNGSLLTTVGGSVVTYTTAGLPAGNTTYRVDCTNTGGTGTGNTVTFKVPLAPTGLSVTCPAPGTTANFTWTLPSGLTSTYFRSHTSPPAYADHTAACVPAKTPPNGSCTTISGSSFSHATSPNTNYFWYIHASDAYGNWGPAEGSAFYCAPPAPNTPTITGPTTGTVGNNYNFNFTATDSVGMQVKYAIDSNNDSVAETTTALGASGFTYTWSNGWGGSGTKYFKVKTIASDSRESAWVTYTFNVLDLPTVSITPASTEVNYNTAGAVSWSSTGAVGGCNVTKAGGAWQSGTSGTSVTTGALTADTVFDIYCSNGVDTTHSAMTIYVKPGITINASPTTVSYNTASTISWSTSYASSCNITKAGSAWMTGTSHAGATSLNLLATTVFGISCNSASGHTQTSSITVTVSALNGACNNTVIDGCTSGILTQTPADDADYYYWTCEGRNSGTNSQTCSYPKPKDGVCDAPDNSCIAGSLSDIPDITTYKLWECVGLYGGATSTCKSPETPIITGPTSCGTYKDYEYSFTLNNPTGGLLSYYMDWDNDGVADQSGGTFPSGTKIDLTKQWTDPGIKYFKVKTGSSGGGYSLWSTIYAVTCHDRPTISLDAMPSTVEYNSSTKITWSSNDADTCTVKKDGVAWKTGTSGTDVDTGLLTERTVFTLSCENIGGTNVTSIYVNVKPSITISATPNPVDYNTATNISWISHNASSCWVTEAGLNPRTGTSNPGISSNNLTSTTDFVATCISPENETKTATATVAVNSLNGACNNSVIDGCTSGVLTQTPADDTNSNNWTCEGRNGGTNSPTCSYPKINGVCNNSATDSCTAGDVSQTPADDTNYYYWTCTGKNNGTNSPTCFYPKPVNGVCGGPNDTCTYGSYSDTADTAVTKNWNCAGTFGGTTANCKSPEAPIITGPTSCAINTNYNYVFSSNDIEGKNYSYNIDWDNDGTAEQSVGTFESGATYTGTNQWAGAGVKNFKARVLSVDGRLSPWSTAYSVTCYDKPTLSITAASPVVYYNSSTTVTWTSSADADSCSVTKNGSAWQTGKSGTNVSTGNLLQDKVTFTLTCTNIAGSSTASVDVLVRPNVTISATPNPIDYGASTNITWTSQGAAVCSVTRAGEAWESGISGTAISSGSLLTNTTFIVTCESYYLQTDSDEVDVIVNPLNGACNNSVIDGCTSGVLTQTPADDTNSNNWTCEGRNGGTNSPTCSYPKINGVCNNSATDSCTAGDVSQTPADDTNYYYWTCTGKNNGTNSPTCFYPKAKPGICGAPNNNCVDGSFSDVADTATNVKWKCAGIYGGTDANCQSPDAPAITGPTSCAINTNYSFGFMSNDQAGKSMYYEIDWDNNGSVDTTTVTGAAGWSYTGVNQWAGTGAKYFKARAVSVDGRLSPWSTAYSVTCYDKPTLSITSSPNVIDYNTATAVTWTSTDATSCSVTANGVAWKTGTSGTSVDSGLLTTDTTFLLTCNNIAGNSTASTVVKVRPSVTITASSNPINYNTATNISWTSSNSSSCSITKGGVAWKTGTNNAGVTSDPLTANTAFVATCTSLGGETKSATVIVAVNALNGACDTSSYNKCLNGTTFQDVADDATNYKWNCAGFNGGTTANCTAPIIKCGVAWDTCDVGNPLDGTDSGGYARWTCNGTVGQPSAACSILQTNGACGTPNNSCVSGSFSDVVDTASQIKWNCAGTNGGTLANCKSPNAPTITGPTTGAISTSYNFNISGTDDLGTSVKYAIDWDNDGTADETTSLGASGWNYTAPNNWGGPGAKYFKVRTISSDGRISPWSTTYTITIYSAPVITITSALGTVDYNNSTTVTWTSSNATSCTIKKGAISGWQTGLSGTNVSTGNLTSYTAFDLSCTGLGGTTVVSTTVLVRPQINAIATPSTIDYGTSSIISWTTNNASSCTGMSTSGTSNAGVSTGNLTSSQTYTISCTAPGGATKTADVNVTVKSLNGVCNETHFLCDSGNSTNNQGAGIGVLKWTWTCSGANGGESPSCSETKPLPNPPTITGTTTGKINTSYTFGFQATNPSGDPIRYAIDWDNDGDVDEYLPGVGMTTSGTKLTQANNWAGSGIKTFKARTETGGGPVSDWTTWNITLYGAPIVTWTPVSTSIPYGSRLSFGYSSTDATYCNLFSTIIGDPNTYETNPYIVNGDTSYSWTSAGPYERSFKRKAVCYNPYGEYTSAEMQITVFQNGASCGNVNIPKYLTPGQEFEASSTMTNTNQNIWTNGSPLKHRLYTTSTLWGSQYMNLTNGPINSGGIGIFKGSFTAPTATGTYSFVWRAIEEGENVESPNIFGPLCDPSTNVDSDGDRGIITVSHPILGVGPTDIDITDYSMPGSYVAYDPASTGTIRIHNKGGGNLIGTISITGNGYSCYSGCAFNLAGGESQNVEILFQSTTTGTFPGLMTATAGSQVKVVNISESTSDKFTITTTPLDFGQVPVSRSKYLNISITNNSISKPSGAFAFTPPSPFYCESGCASASIPPGGTRIIKVRFTPTTIDISPISRDVILTTTPSLTVRLIGQGIKPIFKVEER